MSTKNIFGSLIPVICGILLVVLFIVLGSVQAEIVNATVESTVRYVSVNGTDDANDCSTSSLPCRTIKHAIYNAIDGDDIYVSFGHYTGTMSTFTDIVITSTVVITKNLSGLFGGYSADFSSRDPNIYPTVIDAEGNELSFVVFISNTNTIVDGFTLTGARRFCTGDCPYYWGGGVFVLGGTPTISHNKIQNNVSFGMGGGIRVAYGASPVITDNLIYSNTTDNSSFGYGGGIAIDWIGAFISGNEIISNVAETEGGGIYIGWNVPVTITNNTIAYNEVISSTAGHGAGIRFAGDSLNVNIIHNDIYGNKTQIGGSGIHVDGPVVLDRNFIHDNNNPQWGASVYIGTAEEPITLTNNIIVDNFGNGVSVINFKDLRAINNTIAGNIFIQPDSPGIGLDIGAYPITPTYTFTATIYNNIIVNNDNCGIYGFNGVSLFIDYNDIHNNQYDYCDLASAGLHDISSDPMFVSPPNDNYHLLAMSPAINTGYNSIAPTYDFDGVFRPQGLYVDMGAYEFIFNKIFLPIAIK